MADLSAPRPLVDEEKTIIARDVLGARS